MGRNKKNLFILLLIIVLLIPLSYFLFYKKDSTEIEKPEESETIQEESFTPEEVLEEPTSLGEDIEMALISPEGEEFETRQARMWQAELENINIEGSLRAICKWEFYLNENNEEVLYQEMENKSSVSKENPKLCTFTSTFIEKKGKLRVKLEAEIQNMYNETLGIYDAEREYTVL